MTDSRPEARAGPHTDARRARAAMCLGALGTAILTVLAFPPVGLWWLAFAAPVPLVWAADRAFGRLRPMGAALAAVAGIMPLWALQQRWILGVSAPGAVLLVVYLSLFSGAFVVLAWWCASRWRAPVWFVAPWVLAGLEWSRAAVLFKGYPWLLAGHPIIESPALARAGAVVGASGVSLMVNILACTALGVVVARGRWRAVGAATGLGIAGVWALASIPAPVRAPESLRVAVVQTNVPQDNKQWWAPPQRMADLDMMLALTELACTIDPPPDLIVWPETMFPGTSIAPEAVSEERAANLIWSTPADEPWPELGWVVSRGPDGIDPPAPVTGPFESGGRLVMPTAVAADSVLTWQSRLGPPLLLGSEGYENLRLSVDPATGAVTSRWDRAFNSSFLVVDGRVEPTRYDKLHLTPFGEVMPYISAWPWLERLFLRVGVGASGMSFDLDAGDRPVWHAVPTDSGPVRVGTPICSEGAVPAVCRRLTYIRGLRQADLLVQLTNEGWFGGFDGGRSQHLQIVRWRARELGTSVVRAANTGVSAVIDPWGGVVRAGVGREGRRELYRAPGVLWAQAPLAEGETLYARIGDACGWLGLGVCAALALLAAARPKPDAPWAPSGARSEADRVESRSQARPGA
jgi:apolipoprotein N-acyltransferase